MSVILGIIFIYITFIIVISIQNNKINKNLDERGITTTATIISQKTAVEYVDGGILGTDYKIQFYDTNKKMYQGTFRDCHSKISSVGEEIEIIYDPLKPKHFQPSRQENYKKELREKLYAQLIIGAAIVIITTIIFR